ncbi:MAG: hypothetical protein WC954_04115 [Sphaerochaeta sp.]
MMQLYFLSVAYLIIGGAFLLADSHGLKLNILYSLRFLFRNNTAFRLTLIISGFGLTIGLALFPSDPGPRIIGDLVPMITIALLTLFYLFEHFKKPLGEGGLSDRIAHSVERTQERLGFATLIIALIHFLLPHFVLL